jgi:hypothetical protein
VSIAEAIDAYSTAELAIFRAFGFKGAWRYYPIDDMRNMHWFATSRRVTWAVRPVGEAVDSDEYHCVAEVRHGPFHVDGLTAFAVDTQCDGNVFFMIFDDAKCCELTQDQRDAL